MTITENHPASESSDSLLASRTVPGPRRSSNDEKSSLFKTANTIFQKSDSPIDFLMKPPPRSFSIDVGSMHQHESYISSSLFPKDQTASHQSHIYLPQHYISQSNSNHPFTSSSTSADQKPSPNMNSTRSMESLQSKGGWTHFLDRNYQHQADKFYGQPKRRPSHGWLSSSESINPLSLDDQLNINALATTTIANSSNSSSTSYSYSDIHMASLGYHHSNMLTPSKHICQYFYQYGHCSLNEKCPYSHIPNVLTQQISLPTEGSNSVSYATASPVALMVNHPNIPSHPSVQMNTLYDVTSAPLLNSSSNKGSLDLQPRRAFGSISTDSAEISSKYAGASLEDFQGKLPELCKDQNGCRFLQTKLDESPANVAAIFHEIHPHFVDLMTDPFGNYLCQKLLERCSDTQRTGIVDVIAPELPNICLSMHGTRAVQKLIDYLSTKEQIQAVIQALEPNVTTLIKDLNGNHVIQKCLHKLSPEHNQFIYDVVSDHCVEVASHKHGCCVYQRCIDHAIQSQKVQLINVITKHALALVQDPFGNYVVQYVLGLGVPAYHRQLIQTFIEPIHQLSVQKFSSNVIEKCIRVAEKDTRRRLIARIILHPEMDKFLRDSYANYVIQTCLDCADKDQRAEFVECIKPLLPSIRNTPYGKRIYSKINRDTGSSSSSTRTTRQQSRAMEESCIVSNFQALGFNNNSIAATASTVQHYGNKSRNSSAIAYI